jgi:hypothetical protein
VLSGKLTQAGDMEHRIGTIARIWPRRVLTLLQQNESVAKVTTVPEVLPLQVSCQGHPVMGESCLHVAKCLLEWKIFKTKAVEELNRYLTALYNNSVSLMVSDITEIV